MVQKLSGEPQILLILYGHNINIIYKAGSFNLSQKFIAQEIFLWNPRQSVKEPLGSTLGKVKTIRLNLIFLVGIELSGTLIALFSSFS